MRRGPQVKWNRDRIGRNDNIVRIKRKRLR